MPPLVALDARMWDHPGIGRYVCQLAREFATTPDWRFLLIAGGRPDLERGPGSEYRASTSRIYSIREHFEVPRLARGAALLHVPHFNVPLGWPGPLVVTVHDLLYLHDPAASRSAFGPAYLRFLLRRIRRRAAAVLTVSEATRRDLIENAGIPGDRIFVTPEAASAEFRPLQDDARALDRVRREKHLEKPFILHVGTLKPHKNVQLLIRAVERLRERGLPHELVLVGRKDARQKALMDLVDSKPFVRHLGVVSDPELAALYSLTDAFVIPSLIEGFGLPLLEAMACGAPCLASDRSSLPEVLGPEGVYFDPERVDALEAVLYNVLQNRELRQKMSVAAMNRARHFSWRKTAEQTLQVYQQALA